MEKANEQTEIKAEQQPQQQVQRQGISPDQLFQQFTKSASVVQNSFQLLFEGTQEMNGKLMDAIQTIKYLEKLLADNGISIEQKKPTLPNRQQRRKAEREAKKNDKPAK